MSETKTYLYEILVRFGPDGLTGAHVKDMHEFTNPVSGRPMFDEGLARPIAVEECGEYLTPAVANAVAKLADREEAFAALREQAKAELEGEVRKANEGIAAEREALEAERAEVRKLRDALASAAATVMSTV